MSATGRSSPTARTWLLVVAVALVFVGVVSAAFASRTDELDVARALVADEDAFARASTAGETLNKASVHLQNAGEDCDGDRCGRLFTAAAMARTSAVVALRCKRPQLFEMRLAFDRYLDELADGRAPDPPFPPAC